MKKQSIAIVLGIALLSTGILINSCRKTDEMFPEFNNLSDSLSVEGAIAAPLIDTELSLFNFVPEGDSSLWMAFDDEGLVHARMYYNEIVNIQMRQIYGLPFPLPGGIHIPADSLKIETDTSKMKVYSKMLTGHLYFDDPKIKFIFRNEIPVVTYYRLDTLLMYDDDNNELSHTEDTKYTINAPTVPGGMVKDSIIIDKNRIPELPDVFSPIPKFVSFKITIGHENDQTLTYPVTGNEKLTMDVDIDLPLEVKLEDLVMSDTLNFIDIESDTYKNIDTLVLKVEFDNGYPFEAVSQIYITDTTDTGEIGYRIDSLFSDTSYPDIDENGWTFQSAETDASGFVTANGSQKSMISITLNKDRLEKMKNEHASKMVIMTNLNSYNIDQNLDVRIMSYYTLGLKIAVRANISGSTEDVNK